MDFLITVLCIVACVLLFSFAIFIHEFGHFLAARILGLRVERFSIGFGPALWKKRVGEVEYRVSAIPFGGYVALPQLDPEGTDALQGGSSGASCAPLPPWKRIVVAFAGPFGNIVLAVVLACALAAAPGARFGELPALIGEVPEKGPAHAAGMRAGDRVTRVNGHAVNTWSDMQVEVQIAGGKAAAFVVERGGKEETLTVTPVREPASGAYYIMAFSVTNEAVKAAHWMPARNPLKQLAWDAGQIFRVLQALVTPKEAKAAASSLGGPVMIAEGLYRQVRRNGWDALGFLRFLDVNLAILNLLPLPVLDGGLILLALLELIFRRKPPKKLTDTVSMVFMYLLLGVMVLLVFRDVSRSRRIHKAEREMERRIELHEERGPFKPAFDLEGTRDKGQGARD